LPLKEKIVKELNVKVSVSIPGNFLSAASPSDLDKKIALKLGEKAIELGLKKQFGFMAAVKKDFSVAAISLSEVFRDKQVKKMDDTWFDFKNLYPKKKFINYLKKIL